MLTFQDGEWTETDVLRKGARVSRHRVDTAFSRLACGDVRRGAVVEY